MIEDTNEACARHLGGTKTYFTRENSRYKIILQLSFQNHILKITIPPTHTTGEFTVGKAYMSMILLSTNSQSEEGRVRCIQHHVMSKAQRQTHTVL